MYLHFLINRTVWSRKIRNRFHFKHVSITLYFVYSVVIGFYICCYILFVDNCKIRSAILLILVRSKNKNKGHRCKRSLSSSIFIWSYKMYTWEGEKEKQNLYNINCLKVFLAHIIFILVCIYTKIKYDDRKAKILFSLIYSTITLLYIE